MTQFALLGLILSAVLEVECLDNGVALTPPMGWLHWERFRCNTDCKNDPDNCISEHLIKQMADHLQSDGFLAAGYEYVAIDDCWPEKKRDKDGKLQPDHMRFPSGFKALGDYVHSKGLKFGVYEDFGVKTCAGYPGSEFHMQTDAQTFADWGVDLLKFDGCNSYFKDFPFGYPGMSHYLNKTGRHIVFGCEWAVQNINHGVHNNYTEIAKACNFWRNWHDVDDSWDSIKNIIMHYSMNLDNFAEAAKPGAWNDPDELVIGDYGLSPDQERTQMAMWAIFAGPLMMSVDLRTIRPSSKAILLNKRVIAVNQDKLGKAGHIVYGKNQNLQAWVRPISPPGSAAIVFVYLGNGGGPVKMGSPLTKLGLNNDKGYNVTETFDGKYLGTYYPKDSINCLVNPTGVFMATATPMQ